MQLSTRLKLIADLVKKGSTLADVGTDHGYVPVHCVLSGVCTKAIAMDVNPHPLEKAKENILKYNLQNSITTRLSDGLEELSPGEADCIVIAGMGGLLICNILEKGIDVLGENTYLILQPMLAQKELRQYLYDNNFAIENEYVCREEDKFYNVIVAHKSPLKMENTPKDIIVGKNIDKNSPDVYTEYLDYKIGVCNKIINGLKMSRTDKEDELFEVNFELEIFMTERKRFNEG